MVWGLELMRTNVCTWHPSIFLLPVSIREFAASEQLKKDFTVEIDGRALKAELTYAEPADQGLFCAKLHFSIDRRDALYVDELHVLWRSIRDDTGEEDMGKDLVEDEVHAEHIFSNARRWCAAFYTSQQPRSVSFVHTFVLRLLTNEEWKRFEGRKGAQALLLHEIGLNLQMDLSSNTRMRALLLNASTDGDVVFVVAGERIRAHSFIIKHFLPVPLLQMSEGASKEIVISDTKPEVFRTFVEYLYTQDEVDEESIIEQHAMDLLVLANKYTYDRLHRLCDFHLARKALSWPRPELSVFELLTFADTHRATKLKEACLERLAVEEEELDRADEKGMGALDKPLLEATFRDLVKFKRRKLAHSASVEKMIENESNRGPA